MRHYSCPNCDGGDVVIKPILVQEIDLSNHSLLRVYEKKKLICQHCGWTGQESEPAFQEV